jgi:hypothetical protein
MKITALENFAGFAILDIEKLFSKLKSHELSRKGRPNHDASLTSNALITSARVGGHDANPTNTAVSSTRRGGDHLVTILIMATPPTSLSTTLRERSSIAPKFECG